ncbi:ADP-ribosylglycohydrolase family protein [Fundidesulfovibrio terrae]|uniref:ADP-ribosylglycohydrolase family protein n=1 Tax=Fundidesulfovibrio terrae TaxID=2922866 RepID=UPI001FAE9F55|nr:ADP-ribosylglycohydrolase family protein [Fundidesulfovibrio terrae]
MSGNSSYMVLGSFVGDSLALGVHWIYDQERIAALGRLDGLKAPPPGSHHTAKQAGDFTHYGDQTLVLLASLAEKGVFDPADFSTRWRALFSGGSTIYADRATKNTLSQLAAGWEPADAGSASDELAGASRIAPLVHSLRSDVEAMVQACRAQTGLTHNNAKIMDSAEFFARTAHAALSGVAPTEGMAKALEGRFPGSPLHGWFKDAQAAAGEDSVKAVARFGQSCHVDGAFQSTVQLISRGQDSPAEALVDSAMAGGDSAARNMLVGMVLCAWKGEGALPQGWIDGMRKKGEIEALLSRIG